MVIGPPWAGLLLEAPAGIRAEGVSNGPAGFSLILFLVFSCLVSFISPKLSSSHLETCIVIYFDLHNVHL